MTRLQEVSPDGVFKRVDETVEARQRRDIQTLNNFANIQARKIAELEDTVANLRTENARQRTIHALEAANWEPRIDKLKHEGKERQADYNALEQRVKDIKALVVSCDPERVKQLEQTIAEQHAAITDFGPTLEKLMSARKTIENLQNRIDEQGNELRVLRDKAAVSTNLKYYARTISSLLDGIAEAPQQEGLTGEAQDMLNRIQMKPGPSGWQPTGVKPELEID